MEEKEIKEFIEKLFLTIETKGLDIESDIKSLDNSIDFRLIINFLHDNDLIKETNKYSDELTTKGLKLKELKTFEGLENDSCFKEYVLTELNNIKNGGFITVTKPLDDKVRIINRVVLRLSNLGVLKQEGWKYLVSKPKHLSKVIELKSIDKYLKWIESKDDSPKIELNIENFIGRDNLGIQSSDSHFKNPKIKNVKEAPNNNPDKKSSLKKFFSNPYVIGSILLIAEEIKFGWIIEYISSGF